MICSSEAIFYPPPGKETRKDGIHVPVVDDLLLWLLLHFLSASQACLIHFCSLKLHVRQTQADTLFLPVRNSEFNRKFIGVVATPHEFGHKFATKFAMMRQWNTGLVWRIFAKTKDGNPVTTRFSTFLVFGTCSLSHSALVPTEKLDTIDGKTDLDYAR